MQYVYCNNFVVVLYSLFKPHFATRIFPSERTERSTASTNTTAGVKRSTPSAERAAESRSPRRAGGAAVPAPPSPRAPAPACPLLLNVLLADTVLNVFRDHNFDSCTLCVCNAGARVSALVLTYLCLSLNHFS